METENLFDRFGAVLKDYIDDEDAQKRRYAKNAQHKIESTQKSESEEQYERLLYMQNAHCRPAVFPRAEQQTKGANDTSFAQKHAENPKRVNTRPFNGRRNLCVSSGAQRRPTRELSWQRSSKA